MADRPIRASDDDRENVVAILREHTAQGRLTLEEFDERMSAAYAAKTWDDLRTLTLDLPAEAGLATGGDGRAGQPHRHEEPKPRASGWGLAVPRAAVLVPLVLLAAVLAGVTTDGYGFPAPLLFIGLFWVFCSRRGCGLRSSRHH